MPSLSPPPMIHPCPSPSIANQSPNPVQLIPVNIYSICPHCHLAEISHLLLHRLLPELGYPNFSIIRSEQHHSLIYISFNTCSFCKLFLHWPQAHCLPGIFLVLRSPSQCPWWPLFLLPASEILMLLRGHSLGLSLFWLIPWQILFLPTASTAFTR